MGPMREDSGGEPQRHSSVTILGTKVDPVGREAALDRVLGMLQGTGQHTVYPVNPEMIMHAQNDAQFREALNRASLGTADGVGIVLAAKVLGLPIQERVAGIDLALSIVEKAAVQEMPLFLLGAAEGVAEQVAQTLTVRFPGLRVAGTYAGSPHEREEESICGRIRDSKAEILLVAYGAPRQELWIHRNIAKTGVRVAMAVGGSFDLIAGRRKRAPTIMQNLGIEWVYRLIQEPWRWKRMLALPRFAVAVVRERLTEARRPASGVWPDGVSESRRSD
jgi:N-acetylglucosaminyldiphosphoundecaprenol N-acetyl-beta-D-mannosaminyltransferase